MLPNSLLCMPWIMLYTYTQCYLDLVLSIRYNMDFYPTRVHSNLFVSFFRIFGKSYHPCSNIYIEYDCSKHRYFR